MINIAKRLAGRTAFEPIDIDYWQQTIETEQGCRLSLVELSKLADICLELQWDEMDDQWGYDYSEVG
jgi:hypothetical protein